MRRHLLAIALRNLVRQRQRSLLTGTAISLGLALVVFLGSFFAGFKQLILRRSVGSAVGAVQVHRKGYLDSARPLSLDMPYDEAFVARLRAVPGVTAVAPRLAFEGLATNGRSASVVFATAIDPKNEYLVCPGRAEVEGAHAELERDGALFGAELATALGLSVGDAASLLVQPVSGGNNAAGVTVRGIAALHLPLQAKTLAIVPLPLAQTLLRMDGRVTEYALGVADLDAARDLARAVQVAVGDEYEVHSWHDRDKLGVQVVGQVGLVLGVILVIAFLLVASAIDSTMQMSLNERVREIGTMLALGVRQKQVMWIFLLEASLLSLVFSALGALAGVGLVALAAQDGLSYTVPDLEPLTIFPVVTARILGQAMGAGIVGAMVAAYRPARRASRASPVASLANSVRTRPRRIA